MVKFWDIKPQKRPSAKELEKQFNEYYFQGNHESSRQIEEVHESNINFGQYNPNQVHPKQI